MQHEYDVIIVGAGTIGLALALGLAKQSLSVAIVDKGNAPNNSVFMPSAAPLGTTEVNNVADDKSRANTGTEFSSRVSAISAASETLFKRLDAWKYIARMQAYTHMKVWDKDGFGSIAFDKSPALGHIIENHVLNQALYQCVQRQGKVNCLFNYDIVNMQSHESNAQISLQRASSQSHTAVSPYTLHAKLLVGADGANSQVRKSFGFEHTFWDYDHSAIVANVSTEKPHNNTAMQAFCAHGPLAFLPLPDSHQCSIVFSQQTEQARKLMALSPREFEKSLQVAIDNQFGRTSLNTERRCFVLRMRYARKWTCPHVAIMGDAAHTIHPLAGQGANLGLADVNTLLTLIAQDPEKLGEYHQLRQYERCRKAEALKVIATMQGFKNLFDGSHPLKRLVRNVGLLGADKLPGVKQFFMQQAMG